MSEARSGAQAVERAVAVLLAFETASGDLGVSEVAHAVGLSVSTTHRQIRALVRGGLLTQDPRTERYQLGPTMAVLGRLAEARLGYGRALPALQELADDTGESVNLGILTGGDVLVVIDVPSRQPLRFDQSPGSRVPAHTSAMGKCLLAFSADVGAAVAALPHLEAATARTITDRQRLQSELDAVRQRGWALNDEERNAGVRAVAAPVMSAGPAIAAISVQGPSARLPDSRLDELAARIGAAARTVAPLLAATSR